MLSSAHVSFVTNMLIGPLRVPPLHLPCGLSFPRFGPVAQARYTRLEHDSGNWIPVSVRAKRAAAYAACRPPRSCAAEGHGKEPEGDQRSAARHAGAGRVQRMARTMACLLHRDWYSADSGRSAGLTRRGCRRIRERGVILPLLATP